MGRLERLQQRAITNWRATVAFAGMAVAVSLALFLGFSGKQIASQNRTVIQEQGTPCVRIEKGPHAGEPSEGCKRLARLLAETCAVEDDLCASMVIALARRLDPGGRRALVIELRRIASERRRRGRVLTPSAPSSPDRGGGGREGGGGRDPSPAPVAPSPSPAPSPGPAPSPEPPPPPRPSPGEALDDILRDPVGGAEDALCALGVSCPNSGMDLSLPLIRLR